MENDMEEYIKFLEAFLIHGNVFNEVTFDHDTGTIVKKAVSLADIFEVDIEIAKDDEIEESKSQEAAYSIDFNDNSK